MKWVEYSSYPKAPGIPYETVNVLLPYGIEHNYNYYIYEMRKWLNEGWMIESEPIYNAQIDRYYHILFRYIESEKKMKTITNTHLISGGNPGAAVAAGAAVIAGTAAVIEAGKTFVEFGHDIGEAIYDKVHKDDNPLGKMHYDKKDYSKAYLDYKYPPTHGHPNNMHGNNFHGSFGNF